MKKCNRFLLGILLVFFSVGCFAESAGLAVRLESRNENSLLVSFILENNSDSRLQVLMWNTPLEENFNADAFLVLLNDEDVGATRVKYTQRLLKRGLPDASDYVILQPGETVSTEVDISEGYATYASGEYTIRFQSVVEVQDLSDDENLPQSVKLVSESLTAYQGFELSAEQSNKDERSTSCSASQDATILQAWNAAKGLAADSVTALTTTAEAQRASAARYTTWFGAYQASRYNTVTTQFNAIRSAVENQPLQFICNNSRCSGGTYAFVFSGSPYEIYVCDGFWNAPMTGTDSKAGTIIHELSHFDVVAGTEDHQYGQSGSRQLALTSPNTAINNADSHEYFAENTPALAMSGGSTPVAPVVTSQTLTPGAAISAALNEGEWHYYTVTGATSVRLYNLTADIDLYIGNGTQPTVDNYICRSWEEGTVEENCAINGSSTSITYIGVRAYSGSGTYSLVATGGAGGDGGGVIGSNDPVLSAGQTVSGSVNAGEWNYYQVTGASRVSLFGLSTDIDLYVSDSGRPTEFAYICRPYSPGDVREECVINTQGTVIVGVMGYESGSYQLLAEGTGVGAASLTRVQLNQTSFSRGDFLQMNMLVSGSGSFDTYAGVIFPDGTLYTFSQPFLVNPVNTILPYHQGLQAGSEQTYTILNLNLPSYLPSGDYKACSLIIPQGLSTAAENWTSVYCENFSIR